MRSREVPFSKDAQCDLCGAVGTFDFIGDLLCPKCAEEAVDIIEEEDSEDDQ